MAVNEDRERLLPEGAGAGKIALEEQYRIIAASKPALKYCEWFDEDSNMWNFSRHTHPYHELLYYVAGKGDVDVSGTNISFSLYDTVIYPAYHEHQDKRIPESRREIICMWIDMPELVFEGPMRIRDRNGVLLSAFQFLYREAKRENPEPQLLEYSMKLLMMLVLREYAEITAGGGVQLLDYALGYIRIHYTERITLDQLAELEHISTSYLSRKFKQRTGKSVIAYINALRIERSKQYLMASALDVNEIAYQVGFDSPKYFHRVFKALTGESPASFRKRYKV